MALEINRLYKRSGACCALEWPLARVARPDVQVQVRRSVAGVVTQL